MSVCMVNKINMKKIICVGFFLVLLALGSQSARIQGNIVRNLLNAASKNETRTVNIYNQILKQEVENEAKIFGTFKNELEEGKRANLRRKAEKIFKRQALPSSADNQLNNVKDLRDELNMEEIPRNFAYNAGLNKAAALLLPVISSLREKLETNQTDLVFGTLETELGDIQRDNRKTERVFKRQASLDVLSSKSQNKDNVQDLRDDLKKEILPDNFAYNAGLNMAALILLPVISELRNKLNEISTYAKDRYCAMNLRSSIEGIRLRTASHHTDDLKRQNALDSQLGTLLKNREKTLRSLLITLALTMKSMQDDPKEEIVINAKKNFTTSVKTLRELDLCLPDKPRFFKDKLIKEMSFLNKKTNCDESTCWEVWIKEHKEFWFQKSTMWKSEEDLNNVYDALTIRKLSRNITIEKHTKIADMLMSEEEFNYVKAVIRTHAEGLQATKQSEICLWVTAVHPKGFFNNIVKEVSKKSVLWKNLDDVGKHIEFCAALGKFYNTLSVIDPHRDAPPLPKSCPVGSEDFKKYAKEISFGFPDLTSVAEALITLTGNHELFEEITTVKP